jgi:hypothetical protein
MEWTINPLHIYRVKLTRRPHKLTIIMSGGHIITIDLQSYEEADQVCESLIAFGKKHRSNIHISGYGDLEING